MRNGSRYYIRFNGVFSYWFYGTLTRSNGITHHFSDIKQYNRNRITGVTLRRELVIKEDDALIGMVRLLG